MDLKSFNIQSSYSLSHLRQFKKRLLAKVTAAQHDRRLSNCYLDRRRIWLVLIIRVHYTRLACIARI